MQGGPRPLPGQEDHGRVAPRRIGLLGGESTGKTSLALALADALPAFIADEYLRDFVRDFGRVPALADQEGIYLTQQMTVSTVMKAAAFADVPWVIADPLPLMTAIYSIVYFDDDSLLEAGLQDAATYDAILWCAPDIPWVAEAGVRDGMDYRGQTDEVIEQLVRPRLPLLRVEGTPDQRLTTSLRTLDESPEPD
jgi:nicotinamide riboside kinase